MTWRELYERAAASAVPASGHYHDNVRVEGPDGPVIVRIPIRDAETMDLRLWPEEEVLRSIAPHVPEAPRLLFASGEFQVHSFVPGDLLDDLAPFGTSVPAHVPGDVARLFGTLARIPQDKLPTVPPGWPTDGDTSGFALRLSGWTRHLYESFREQHSALFARLGIPDDPLAALDERLLGLTPRPFGCLHADMHRANLIVRQGESAFLDWELALWGDPVYELAVHLRRTGYPPRDRAAMLERWLAEMPRTHTEGWEDDLRVHLVHEHIKAAMVMTVRALGVPRAPFERLTASVNAAREFWGVPGPLFPGEVRRLLTSGG
ncbi:aminoglycoside phosphotransferase family protein [Spirillospora sp. CA-294931]|uniref:aminoglycoside phosphotransferase family protein n=1 Tax=Spirillospora sp. CA-294931 TaxID=3240042 RepID=UPI003D927BEA